MACNQMKCGPMVDGKAGTIGSATFSYGDVQCTSMEESIDQCNLSNTPACTLEDAAYVTCSHSCSWWNGRQAKVFDVHLSSYH